MSGARLCALLGELGYEGIGTGTGTGSEALDPDSFEWPFQYEDTRPILHWICSTLRPSNILSLSELSQLLTTDPLSLSLSLLTVSCSINFTIHRVGFRFFSFSVMNSSSKTGSCWRARIWTSLSIASPLSLIPQTTRKPFSALTKDSH